MPDFCAVNSGYASIVNVRLLRNGVAVPGVKATLKHDLDGTVYTTLVASGQVLLSKGDKLTVELESEDGKRYEVKVESTFTVTKMRQFD